MNAQVVAQLLPVSHELADDAAYFRAAMDDYLQRVRVAWSFNETTLPVMVEIEGTPARWDMTVMIEERVDWSWGA